MKKKSLKQFVISYFYTLQKEQQGTYLLLFLLGVIGIVNASLPLIVKPNPIGVTFVSLSNKDALNKTVSPKPESNKIAQSPSKIELNTADSIALEKLYKIGPKLAGKIVAYRKKLGGYHSLFQLSEIYGFQEDLLYDLQDQIRVNANLIQKININTCKLEQLQQHPYFKFTLSKQIVNYREQHGVYQSLNDLKNLKSVNDSVFQLIRPYIQLNP